MTALAIQQPRVWTLADIRAMPEGRPYYELEKGRLIEMASPTARHNDISLVVGGHVRSEFQRRRLGRVFLEPNVILPDGTYYIPDLAFLLTPALGLLNPETEWIEGSPDVVVEITSADPARDRVVKFKTYYENDVPWYWLVDQHTLIIEEYQYTPDGYLRTATAAKFDVFRPKALPGLEINLAALLGIEQPAAATNAPETTTPTTESVP